MSWWKFWQNKKQFASTDLSTLLANLPIMMLLNKQEPFEEWRPPVKIPEQCFTTIWFGVIGYKLLAYLEVVEELFGNEVLTKVREHQNTLFERMDSIDDMKSMGAQLSGLLNLIRYSASSTPLRITRDDNEIAVPMEMNIAILLLHKLADSPYYVPSGTSSIDNFPDIDQDIALNFALCLTHAKGKAREVFKPAIDRLLVENGVVVGMSPPSVNPTIQWSNNPGCFERHLQRKYENPLFPKDKGKITQVDVDLAVSQDRQDARDLNRLVNKFESIPPDELHEYCNMLVRRAAEIGGDYGKHVFDTTRALKQSVLAEQSNIFNDPQHRNVLGSEKYTELEHQIEDAITNDKSWIERFSHPFTGQMSRQDTPIAMDEVFRSLIMEDIDTIRFAGSLLMLNEESRRLIYVECIRMLVELDLNQNIVHELKEKLEAMGMTLGNVNSKEDLMIQVMISHAKDGDIIAQYKLGTIYAGLLPNDYAEAMKWFSKAAERGHPEAQYNVGLIYEGGLGVSQDLIQAHVWFDLATAQGNSKAKERKDLLAKRMTPNQIDEAQRLAGDWESKAQG